MKSAYALARPMLFDIQTANFFCGGNAKANGVFDDQERDGHRNGDPGCNGYDTQRLHADQMPAAAVEHAAVNCEEANQQGAQRTVDTHERQPRRPDRRS